MKQSILVIIFIFSFTYLHAGNSKKILINEFLASNSTGLTDVDGDHSDWIELYNPGNESVNLYGWSLTDNESKLRKWIFPSVSIEAEGYLLIFASGKDRVNPANELHTNFNLSKDGEYLALIESDGTISDEYTPAFPPQTEDVSYGFHLGEYLFFNTPTPGTENTLEGQALSPVFSVGRGFYNVPFTVSLTTNDPDTKVYYTTDGTRPTAESIPYTEPVSIVTTTPLSAVGIKDDASSLIVTHTYFFIDDIMKQPALPEGYPDRWGVLGSDVIYDKYKVGERAPAHYAMSPEVYNDSKYKNYITEGFLSIPSVSIVTTPDYLFSDVNDETEGGIYIYTGVRTGNGWERPVSIEYYDPATEKQFQINCGLRIHGAASRQPEKSVKHSFRTHFRKIYGAGKLNFDLFEKETAVTKFDHLVFRAGFGFSWMHWGAGDRLHSQYVIDSFAKRTQLSMGQASAHDRFVHLFINGLYWGLYDISERISNNFMEAYFGGKDTDYDVMNHNGLVDGKRTDFDRMVSQAQAGNYNQLVAENLIILENYIDYVLINFYMGNTDWGDNNWYAARNRITGADGFRFFIWDTENCFFSGLNFNVMTNAGRFKGPLRQIIFGTKEAHAFKGGLFENEEFRMLFADRVQKHFFNGGALSPERTAALYEQISDEIDKAIILESARWGSYRRDVLPGDGKSPLYTRDNHWLPKKKDLLKNHFPYRTGILYDQLLSLNLVSDIDAPVFNSAGGEITGSVNLMISAKRGNIYYTVDGSDPRERGTGSITASAKRYNSPLEINRTSTIKARTKMNNVWSALSEISFVKTGTSDIILLSDDFLQTFYSDEALHITFPKEGFFRLDVYAVDGKLVRHINSHASMGKNKIAMQNISHGLYIYRIEFEGKVNSGKFLK